MDNTINNININNNTQTYLSKVALTVNMTKTNSFN